MNRTTNAGGAARGLLLVAALLLAGLAPAVAVRAQDSGDALSGRTATVCCSGDGVNLRATPDFGGAIIDRLADGTVVQLRIDQVDTVLDPDGQTRWWPVRVYGQDGWIAGYYLDTSGSNTSSSSSSADGASSSNSGDTSSSADTGPTLSGDYARVTSPDGANLRAGPGSDAEIIAVLSVNTIVKLRIDQVDTVVAGGTRWWPVEVNGQQGWLAGTYLASADSPPVTPPAVTPEAAPFGAGDYVAAKTLSGLGANIRAGAGTDYEPIGYVPEGNVVQVMDGPYPAAGSARGWFKITDGQVTGYVDGDLLTPASQPAPPPAPTQAPVPTEAPTQAPPAPAPAKFAAGDFASPNVPAGVNLRDSASLAGAKLGVIPSGAVVQILDGPVYDANGDAWYHVDTGMKTGYAIGRFLDAASGPISAPAPAVPAAPAPAAPAAVAGVATGTFMYPLASFVLTQGYGCSPFSIEPWDATLGCHFHNGVDLAAPAYTPIMAADGGVVKYAGWCDCGLGYYVEIDHGNGFSTVYGHMAEQPWVATGQAVAKGQTIGPVGSTGASTGPHVHFMIKLNGATVNPLGYLP